MFFFLYFGDFVCCRDVGVGDDAARDARDGAQRVRRRAGVGATKAVRCERPVAATAASAAAIAVAAVGDDGSGDRRAAVGWGSGVDVWPWEKS